MTIGVKSYLDLYMAPLAPFLAGRDVTDIYVNRPGEAWVETINGAIVRLAAEVGVATPVTQALADLVRAGEVQGSGA